MCSFVVVKQRRTCPPNKRASMSKRTHEESEAETKEETRARLTRFLRSNVNEPGMLAVVIARKARMIMTMFTYSLTTTMSPTAEAMDMATGSLERIPAFQEFSFLERLKTVKLKACAIDDWNRCCAGITVVQAILSCAAGLKTISDSGDKELANDPETAKRLVWSSTSGGQISLTNTVDAALGYAGGIEKDVIEALTFNPMDFENDFIGLLEKRVPCMHLTESCNKIVIFDMIDNTDKHILTPYSTTYEIERPKLPTPF